MPDTSIKRRLVVGVIGTLLVTWLIMIALVYRSSAHEIAEIYDASLATYARVLATLMMHEAREELDIEKKLKQVVSELGLETVKKSRVLSEVLSDYDHPAESGDYLTLEPAETNRDGHEYESKIAFLIKSADGRVLLRSSVVVPMEEIVNGYRTIDNKDGQWRVFGLTEHTGAIGVMVGERLEVRTELLQEILLNLLGPFVLALPLILLLLIGIIKKGLGPLKKVAEKVAARSHLSLEPLSTEATPLEVVPLVDEINDLFIRIEQAMENERRFTANAAHELRTPLAAIKTQVQVLQLDAGKELEPYIAPIVSGVDRTTHLVEQLLTLARAEARSHQNLKFDEIDLVPIIRNLMRDKGKQAEEKNISLSFVNNTQNQKVMGEAGLLNIIMRNILDNALRYTPVNGSVKIIAEMVGDRFQLAFEDSGPGIPPEQRELMFQRFQRGPENQEKGVGLGLHIVRQIAELHGIEIQLLSPEPGRGFVFQLLFSNR